MVYHIYCIWYLLFCINNDTRSTYCYGGVGADTNFGTTNEESCDFPDFAKEACDFVVNNESYRGLLICGSGVGMSIAANKIKGIRAANVVDIETAKQSVEHNDVNVLCLGSKNVNEKNAMDIIEIFLETEFIQKEKYIRRVSKLEH